MDLLLYSARSGCQTLAFVTSRRLSELIRRWANQQDSTVKILSYRAGYSPKIRRDIESKLKKGEIKGVVSTNALELGIDIGQLDVIIISGYPGSISSFWQQAGRAGRKMQDSAVFYIPSEDAMQKYILRHPDILTSRNFESALISTNNPNIIAGHVPYPKLWRKQHGSLTTSTRNLLLKRLSKKALSQGPRAGLFTPVQKGRRTLWGWIR
jgi:DEAD/DEAH box helicase domain-containing protein